MALFESNPSWFVCAALLVASFVPAAPGHAADGRLPEGTPIVVGVEDAYPPYQFLDEKGEPAGYDVDLVKAVAAALSWEIEFRVGPWSEILDALVLGEIDLIPGMPELPEREAKMDFSVPTAHLHHAVFVSEGSQLDDRNDLIGKRVMIQEDSVHHAILRVDDYGVDPIAVPTPERAIEGVAGGDAEAAVIVQLTGLYLKRKLGLQQVHSINVPLAAWEYRFAVPEGREALLASVNDGLARIHESGEYDRIHDQWFGVLKPEGVPESRVLAWVGGVVVLALAALSASVYGRRALQRRVDEKSAELLRAEEERHVAERRLLQAESMETLGRLAGGVAHDFNNLLTAVLGNVSFARERGLADRELDPLLEEIERAGSSAAQLSHRLLGLARNRLPEPRPVSWGEVLTDVEPMLRRLIPREIAIRTSAEEDAWPASIDPGQATQVVLNLALNARDALGDRGEITLRAENRVVEGERIACLEVRDDGPGMDEATRRRIFEPFFTTKGESGTGVGLATVRDVAEDAGGRVEVESPPGSGSVFRVLLPALDPSAQVTRAALHLTAESAAGERVLFVDDDPAVRRVARRILDSLGYRATVVEDAAAALRTLESGVVFDALVTDLSMPGESGAELARRVRARFPAIRVLYTSGYAPDRADLPDAGDGSHGFIAKPFRRQDLAWALREALG